jgi:hypothetical protein
LIGLEYNHTHDDSIVIDCRAGANYHHDANIWFTEHLCAILLKHWIPNELEVANLCLRYLVTELTTAVLYINIPYKDKRVLQYHMEIQINPYPTFSGNRRFTNIDALHNSNPE